ncbi:MAG: nucleotide exchange factor GrpE [Bacteroidales bacterium]|nr:nucleotide exchange factor GrpE [Bacteroidales bacterium]
MSKEDKIKEQESHDEIPTSREKDDHVGAEGVKSHSKKDKQKKHDHDGEAIKQWQLKCDKLNDKYLRLYSEFDNYRKRTQKERIEFNKTASEDIILSLLPVIDDLERALKSTLKTGDEMEVVPKEGLQLIYQKFKGLLAQKGLEVIPAQGEIFNVDFHDALTNIPAPSEDLKGKVVDEVEKGYMLNGKVIRYSKVVVGN